MATVDSQVETLRSKLLAMARQQDPYPFLSGVEDYLAAEPFDAQLRASAMGAAIQKGLYSLAIELAEGCPPESQQAEELRSAAKKLKSLPSDRLSPSGLQECFKRNLSALHRREPWGPRLVDGLETAWEKTSSGLTFHRANDGNVLARGLRSDGRWMWLPAALDFANQIERVQNAEDWKGFCLPPFLIDGVGLGWFIPRLYQATTRTFLTYSPAIFVVEPNPIALAIALHLHDYDAILRDERVFFFGGPSAWSDWVELMERENRLALPRQIVHLPRWGASENSDGEEMRSRLRAHRAKLLEEADRRVNEIYAGRDARYWAERFASAGPAQPLRVLAFTSRFTTFLQHSTRDLLAAFEQAGMKTYLLIETRDHHYIPEYECLNTVAEFQPDLIVLLDHHRHEYPNRFPENVPFVCWIQDELPNLFNLDVGERLGPLDFTIGFGVSRCVSECGYSIERFMPCKVPVNPSKFAALIIHPPAPPLAKSRTRRGEGGPGGVAYVSHQSEPPESFHARLRQQANPDLRRLLDAFYEQTRPLLTSERFNAGYDPDTLLKLTEAGVDLHFGDSAAREQWMGLYVRPLIDRTLRHTTLNWVADWAEANARTLHLYGRGWEQHPRFAKYARGPAQHGEHLAEISRQAAINLHCGINPALHQRVFEICASGGFLMVRYHPHDFYPPGFAMMSDHILRMGIEQPCRIPLTDFPDQAIQALRLHAAQTGSELGESFEVSAEFLLELKARQGTDRRYYHAEFAFPHFKDVTFDNARRFAELADAFLDDPERRQTIAKDMQQAVGDLFTYDALVPRIVKFVGNALAPACGASPSKPSTLVGGLPLGQ